MNVLEKQRTRWLLSAMAVVFVAITALMVWGTFNTWHDRHTQVFDSMLQTDAAVRRDLAILYQLNDANLGFSCDERMLKAMRLAELNSQYLYAYGFVKNGKLECTTTLGAFAEAKAEAPYDLTGKYSGISFRRAVPITSLPGNVVAMRVKYGHFQALIRPFTGPAEQLDWLHAEVYAFTGAGFVSLYDKPSIKPRGDIPSSERLSWFENGRYIQQLCYGFETCGLSIIDIFALAREKSYLYFIALLCTLVITALSGALSWQLHKRYCTIARQLKRGLSEDRITITYQPIVTLEDDITRACEVLCRWRDDNGCLLNPDAFIPDIETNGQYHQLTEIVIRKAVAELKEKRLLGKLKVAFNAFPEDIVSGHAEKLLKENVPARLYPSIALEITEKEIEDLGEFAEGLKKLRAMHIKIAIDDFGTGYSNLKHLEDLKVDYVKIDKSFIRGLESQMMRGGLVAHIVNMAHSLKLRVIAEGVENAHQYTQVKHMAVDFSQGFFHAEPMQIEAFADFVRTNATRRTANIIALEG